MSRNLKDAHMVEFFFHVYQLEQTKFMDWICESRHINKTTFYSLFRTTMKKENSFILSIVLCRKKVNEVSKRYTLDNWTSQTDLRNHFLSEILTIWKSLSTFWASAISYKEFSEVCVCDQIYGDILNEIVPIELVNFHRKCKLCFLSSCTMVENWEKKEKENERINKLIFLFLS
jgi:hypothetical protein